jgi:parallel beta-helix repeat protein
VKYVALLATLTFMLLVVGPAATAGPAARAGTSTDPKPKWDVQVGPRADGECAGVAVEAADALDAAVAANPPGTTFCLRAGVHRLAAPIVPKAGDRFVGDVGAVLSGAKLLTVFDRAGGFWVAGNQPQTNPNRKGVCEPRYGDLCTYPEDVYFDNQPLRRVASLAALKPGSFFFDYAASQIFLADDPTGHQVEVASTRAAFMGFATDATDVTVRNLVIEKFANEAQLGAISCGAHWRVEQNEVRLNHGTGIQSAEIAVGNFVHHNGQLGLSDGGKLVADNEIAFNNTMHFNPPWEAGGAKWVLTDGLVVKHNYVHDNHGPGMWSDIGNVGTRYEGNLVTGNSGSGIVAEISYRTTITRNVIRGNGHGVTPGWLDGAGILIESAPDVTVSDNVLAGNANGITIVQEDRGKGPHGPYKVRNIIVRHNDVGMSRGRTGMAQTVNDATYFKRNIRFVGNRYRLACGAAAPFAWRSPRGRVHDGHLSVKEWRAVGHDRTGAFPRSCVAPRNGWYRPDAGFSSWRRPG